jgi:hypothetical protein
VPSQPQAPPANKVQQLKSQLLLLSRVLRGQQRG